MRADEFEMYLEEGTFILLVEIRNESTILA